MQKVKKEDVLFIDIDTQNDFIDSDGALYVKDSANIRNNLKKITDFAVEKKIWILSSVDAHTFDDKEFDQFPPHCIKGTSGQLKIPETLTKKTRIVHDVFMMSTLWADSEQLIIEKSHFDLFSNQNARNIFNRCFANVIFIYGVATEYCVKATVNSILDTKDEIGIGERIIYLVDDSIMAVNKKDGEIVLKELVILRGVNLISTNKLLSIIG